MNTDNNSKGQKTDKLKASASLSLPKLEDQQRVRHFITKLFYLFILFN